MDAELKSKIMTTGTSLVGIVCKDGIVMAGDRKATAGSIVMSKNSQKVVPINEYIVVSGTGLVADIQLSKKLIKAQLKLKQLQDKLKPTVKEAASLVAMMSYRNVRQASMIPFMAGLMVGGVNDNGTTELYSIDPAGGIQKIEDYDANFSSGMPYILGLLERQYKPHMSIQEGVHLAAEAIKSSSERDTASGFGVDIFTITKEGIKQVSKQKLELNYKEEN